jgi:hypothetical protein
MTRVPRFTGEQTMEWDFSFLPQYSVLSAKVTGDLDYDSVVEFISAGAAEMRKHGCDKILADLRDAVLKLSPTRMYRVPAVEVAYGVNRQRKVAIVLSPSTVRVEDARIYADIMNRNGLPHCLFDDPDAALDWLLDRESSGR